MQPSTNNDQRPRSTVGVYALNKKGEILLIRSPKWQGKLVPPGGHVDYGETVERAAIREMKEETGLDAKNLKLLTYVDIIEPKDFTPYPAHFVGLEMSAELEDEAQEVVLQNDEASEYLWLRPEESVRRDDVEETTRQVIQECFVDKKACDNCGDVKSKWLRALSDYQNLQKETAAQRGEWVRMSELQIIEEFLPVYSNFKKAFAANKEQGTTNKEQDNWAKGIEYIMKQFGDVLKAHDVMEIETVGKKFDPARHEAVSEEEVKGKKPDTIVKEIETGYVMKGKVVRVAKVVVASS